MNLVISSLWFWCSGIVNKLCSEVPSVNWKYSFINPKARNYAIQNCKDTNIFWILWRMHSFTSLLLLLSFSVELELSLLFLSAHGLLCSFLNCKSSLQSANIVLTCSVFIAQNTREERQCNLKLVLYSSLKKLQNQNNYTLP